MMTDQLLNIAGYVVSLFLLALTWVLMERMTRPKK